MLLQGGLPDVFVTGMFMPAAGFPYPLFLGSASVWHGRKGPSTLQCPPTDCNTRAEQCHICAHSACAPAFLMSRTDNSAHGAIATVKDLPAIQANLSVPYESRESALAASATALHASEPLQDCRASAATSGHCQILHTECCNAVCSPCTALCRQERLLPQLLHIAPTLFFHPSLWFFADWNERFSSGYSWSDYLLGHPFDVLVRQARVLY